MAKVMLVEDDNNLREIYEARLLAEGYEIVSARDGEEALALAVKERPDLIIADIMMPKISGFDMLDILRSTPETKDTKVIIMTALSQAEDKARASKLGADRYLVKSQVTLEDVARVAREVLEGKNPSGPDVPAAPFPSKPPADKTPTNIPVATPPEPSSYSGSDTKEAANSGSDPLATSSLSFGVAVASAAPPPSTTAALGEPVKTETATVKAQIQDFVNSPSQPAAIAATPISFTTPQASNNAVLDDAVARVNGSSAHAAPPAASQIDKHVATIASDTLDTSPEGSKTSVHTRVIEPINDLSQTGPNLEVLLAKEEARENAKEARHMAAIGVTGKAFIGEITKSQPSPGAPAPHAPGIDPSSISL